MCVQIASSLHFCGSVLTAFFGVFGSFGFFPVPFPLLTGFLGAARGGLFRARWPGFLTALAAAGLAFLPGHPLAFLAGAFLATSKRFCGDPLVPLSPRSLLGSLASAKTGDTSHMTRTALAKNSICQCSLSGCKQPFRHQEEFQSHF